MSEMRSSVRHDTDIWSMWVDSMSGGLWYELCRMPLVAAKAMAEGLEGASLEFSLVAGCEGLLRADGTSNRYFAHVLGAGASLSDCAGSVRAPYAG